MKIVNTLMAGAAMLALTGPATAQTATSQAPADGAPAATTWQDVTTPSVRVIRRDGQGRVIFDSAAAADAPGASDPALERQIDRADGSVTGATDMQAGPAGADEAQPMQGTGTDTADAVTGEARDGNGAEAGRRMDRAEMPMAMPGTDGDDRRGPASARDVRRGDDAQMRDGDRGAGSDAMSAMDDGGMDDGFDLEGFAQEMFSEGYRQGYVSGLTRMRSQAARQMQNERAGFAAYRDGMARRMERQDRQLQRLMRQEADGTTVIMIPPGMSPAQFLREFEGRLRGN